MSESSRSLPDQPSLRYLKLEARRRLAAGEFPPCTRRSSPSRVSMAFRAGRRSSWPSATASQTRTRTCSIISAGSSPGWRARASRTGLRPQNKNLAEHFEQSYLDRVTPGRLIEGLSGMARNWSLGDEVTVITERPRFILARVGGVRITTVGADEPPHRLRGYRRTGSANRSPIPGSPRRPPTRRARSRRQRSSWPRRPWVSSACPDWCWPASTTRQAVGAGPRLGPARPAKAAQHDPPVPGLHDQHADHRHRRAPPGR